MLFRRSVVFPQELWNTLHACLLDDLTSERSAFVLAGLSRGDWGLRLLVREVVPAPPDAYAEHTAGSLELHSDFVQRVLWRCYHEGHHLVEAHSHPFARGSVSFSDTDYVYEREFFPYVARKIPGIAHASLVLGQDCLDAHMWEPEQGFVGLDEVRIVGAPLRILRPCSAPGTSQAEPEGLADPTVGRHVLAFGEAGQRRLAACTVAVVGLGGLGSLVAQQLAHLGVGRLVLVDADRVEPTNLNRLAGATAEDAAQGTLKVEVARRYARAVRPDLMVEALAASALEGAAQERLKHVDCIVGCVDSEAARAALNWLGVAHYMPYVDCGTGLVAVDGRLEHGGGQVRVVLPGGFCLECIHGIDREEAAQELSSATLRQERVARGYFSAADVPAPAVMFLNSTLASLAVQELTNLLLGFKPCQPYLLYELLAGRLTPLAAQRRPMCAVCGLHAGAGDGAATPWQAGEDVPENLPAVIRAGE